MAVKETYTFQAYADTLAIALTPEQRAAHRVLTALGKRFLVDYGYMNVVAKAAVAFETAKTVKWVM